MERRQRRRVERRRRRALRRPAADAWPFKYSRIERRFVVPHGWRQRALAADEAAAPRPNPNPDADVDEATAQIAVWASIGGAAPCVAPGLELLQHLPIKSEADIGYAALIALGAEVAAEHRVGSGAPTSTVATARRAEEEEACSTERMAIELFADGTRKGGAASADARGAEREAPLLRASAGALNWEASKGSGDFSLLCDAALAIANALATQGSSNWAAEQSASEWGAWSRREAPRVA